MPQRATQCQKDIQMELLHKIVSEAAQPLGAIVLGTLTGMLTGLFGAGGGFILTPALNIFLGLPYNIAIGTSSCLVLSSSSMALYHHFDRRMHGVRIAFLSGSGIPLGSFFGVTLVEKMGNLGQLTINGHLVDARTFCFSAIFAIFLTTIAFWMLLDNFYLRRNRDDDSHTGYLAWVKLKPMVRCDTIPNGPFSAPILVLMGLLIGFLGGFLGVGGGVIMMPMLFYIVGQDTKYAARTSTMLVFFTSLIASVLHASKGNINFLLFATLFLGAFTGVRIGVAIQKKIGGKSLRKYFAFVVLAAVVMVLVKLMLLVHSAPAA